MKNQNQPKNQNPPPNHNPNKNPPPNPNKNPPPDHDFNLRETSPDLAGRRFSGSQRAPTTYDLVEQMDYLYVRVVKAKELPPKDAAANAAADPLVEVRLGHSKCSTNHLESNPNPEFNRVFAFLKDRIQSTCVEILVKDKEMDGEGYLGKVAFEISDVPRRVPPDSPLAPQWYRLEDRSGHRGGGGELMLAVWVGTQADEVFPEASHFDASGVSGDGVTNIRSKVYLSPKLWYLRVNVIEAQDLQFSDKNRQSEVFVKVVLGNAMMKTRVSEIKNVNNPMWNEDLMFVASEPFEEMLFLSVENKVGPNKEEVLGKCQVSIQNVERRLECDSVSTRWYSLEKHVPGEGGQKQEVKIVGRINARISLDGGYHVLDELTQYSSDFRATTGRLGRPGIGVLELGILSAQGLKPMKTKDGRGVTDAYCVAKYGQKWIRTRTIIDSFSPKWNEQYTWEVFDPCTVVTLVVFDNCHLQGVGGGGSKDSRIGKVRIRLSALESGRVYTHSYPLVVLQNSGVKKMGELQLAVRFTCSSMLNMLQMYASPLLPTMHYLHPLSIYQQDSLRHQATQVIATRMGRAEPPLRKEVVEYILDVGSHMWSMRKSKANIGRIAAVLSGLVVLFKWADRISAWKNPFVTVVVHLLCLLTIMEPKLILSAALLSFAVLGMVNFRSRPRYPPHMDARLSHADTASNDELDEEFDTFPTSKGNDHVKVRYDRLRSIAARMQTLLGDAATQGERFCALVSWRDPRATAIFTLFCLVAAVALFFVPIKLVCVVAVFYGLRHPRFRNDLPSLPFNFFRRLPTRADSLL